MVVQPHLVPCYSKQLRRKPISYNIPCSKSNILIMRGRHRQSHRPTHWVCGEVMVTMCAAVSMVLLLHMMTMRRTRGTRTRTMMMEFMAKGCFDIHTMGMGEPVLFFLSSMFVLMMFVFNFENLMVYVLDFGMPMMLVFDFEMAFQFVLVMGRWKARKRRIPTKTSGHCSSSISTRTRVWRLDPTVVESVCKSPFNTISTWAANWTWTGARTASSHLSTF